MNKVNVNTFVACTFKITVQYLRFTDKFYCVNQCSLLKIMSTQNYLYFKLPGDHLITPANVP